ncbi:E3 ubiquitin-protein ligase MIB2 [Geodia barretti]|nr:E3 ubiquitin-protein ligase MIB2 [Geodia barretti]
MEGYLPIIKLLISHRANLNKKNEGELTALQLCVIVNSAEGAKLLVGGGADPNVGDDRGITPLARAAALGYLEVVKLLLDHHRTNPNKQDCQGSTPLHRAIVNHQLQTMIALLNAGADPTIPNHSLHNCMHRAAALGFLAGVEELMKWHPDLINKAKKDGFTPLHMAAVSGHTDIVSLLLSHPSCEVNVDDTDGLTSLHLAAHGGETAMLERLVGYGADLNCATREGNTALHFTLARKNMAAPSPLSPHILEVKKELDQLCGQDILQPEVVVGVFLVREGAKVHAANRLGLHPLTLQPPDVVQLFTRYSTAVDSRPPFHGTLRQKVGPFADICPKTPHKQLKVVETSSSSTISSTPPTASLPPTSPLPTSPPLPSSSSSLPPMTPVPTSTSGVDRSVNEYTSQVRCSPTGKTSTHMPNWQLLVPLTLLEEVVNIIKLCPVCLKNKADVTRGACRKDHHRLCRVCAARSSSVCVLCSSVVLRAPE